MRYIELPNVGKRKLCKRFGKSNVSVWKALHFKTDSELARKIRATALSEELGGREVEIHEVRAGFRPNCNISFERSEEGDIVRTIHIFKAGVVVETDCVACLAYTRHHGELVDRVPCSSVREQLCILFEAQQMAEAYNS